MAPGIIETEGITGAVGGELPDALLEDLAANRFGAAGDCVPVTLFLASPAANYVTGGYFAVDGGHLLQQSPYE